MPPVISGAVILNVELHLHTRITPCNPLRSAATVAIPLPELYLNCPMADSELIENELVARRMSPAAGRDRSWGWSRREESMPPDTRNPELGFHWTSKCARPHRLPAETGYRLTRAGVEEAAEEAGQAAAVKAVGT